VLSIDAVDLCESSRLSISSSSLSKDWIEFRLPIPRTDATSGSDDLDPKPMLDAGREFLL
jgi:hypothetical protein